MNNLTMRFLAFAKSIVMHIPTKKIKRTVRKILKRLRLQRNKRRAYYGVSVLTILFLSLGLVSSEVQLNNQTYKHQQNIQAKEKILRELRRELLTVQQQKTETEAQVQQKAAVEARLKAEIQEKDRQLQAKASAKKQSPIAKATGQLRPATASASSGVPAILVKIRGCESGHNYLAQNAVSTASGAYQFLDSTWAGYKGYSKARHAPPAVQDERAIIEYQRNGTRPWYPSRSCWG